jgi:hypothetical protein
VLSLGPKKNEPADDDARQMLSEPIMHINRRSSMISHRAREAFHLLFCACAVFATCSLARAQTAVPLLEPKPVFVPGMYETESRNSAFPNQPVKSRTCIKSADYDAFRDETMAQYQKAPQFVKDCRLSETKALRNGFAFAMQCKGTKTILTYEFGKDLVRGTIQTLIEAAPQYSSSILTLLKRVGDCADQQQGKPL